MKLNYVTTLVQEYLNYATTLVLEDVRLRSDDSP